MVEKKPRKRAAKKKAAPKQEAVKEVKDAPEEQTLEPILSGTASPAYGTAPYADKQEVSGRPVITPIVDVARPFFATDARSVMVTLRPNHWNFIKNPSLRVNADGWKAESSLLDTAVWSVDASRTGYANATVYNLLTANVASGTDTSSATTGFTSTAGNTTTSSTAQFSQGARSLAVLTSATTATGVAAGGTTTSGTLPVTAGMNYTFTFQAKSSAVESLNIRIYWWTSAGNVAASTASNDGTAANSSTTAWTTYTLTAVAPANAAFASVYAQRVTGASAVTHYLDKFGFWQGVGGTWELPGTAITGRTPTLLTDLSGSGRSATFGNGIAAPVVLPHTGTDYLYTPGGNSNYASITNYSNSITGIHEATWDGVFHNWVTPTPSGFVSTPVIALAITYAGQINMDAPPGYTPFNLTAATPLVLDRRYVIRGTHDYSTHTSKIYVDGVEVASKVQTGTPTTSGGVLLVVGSLGTNLQRMSVYRVTATKNSGETHIFDAVNRNYGYAGVANTGTAGGTWTINRYASGFKAAVVDRPLLLFGGAQHAEAATFPNIASSKKMTAIFAVREFQGGAGFHKVLEQGRQSNGVESSGWWIGSSGTASTTGQAQAFNGVTTDGAGYANATMPITVAENESALVIDGTDMRLYKRGVVAPAVTVASPATITSNGWGLRIGNARTGGQYFEGEFVAAAVWDRALTDDEVMDAGVAMTSGTVAVQQDELLDPDDSWVGKSLIMNGDGVLHYRDVDKDGNPAFVYIGFIENLTTDEYQESVRMSSAWTFSAYVKGTGRVRVVMDAYESAEPWIVGSPPINQNLTTVADPAITNYGDAKVVAPDGKVWVRNDPPFYLRLGVVPTAPVSPDQIDTSILMDPVVVDDTGSVWELTSPYPTQASYYTNWGIPAVSPSPVSEPSGAKYIKDSDGTIYHKISPAPGTVPFYESITLTVHPRPEFIVPDRSQFSRYYVYGTNLWQIIDPIPEAVPYYSNVGAITTLTTEDPATMPPAGLYVKKAEPNGAYGVWMLQPKPYYTNSGSSKFLASVASDWTTLQDQADWVRMLVSTSASFNIEYNPVSFAGCSWIDCRVEVEDATTLKVSSLMLDPSELVIAEYFDGSMTESEEVDDYLWEDEAAPNNSVSWYYYDRKSRVEWLWQNLQKLIPVNRPLRIYFEDYEHPFSPSVFSSALARSTKTAKV